MSRLGAKDSTEFCKVQMVEDLGQPCALRSALALARLGRSGTDS